MRRRTGALWHIVEEPVRHPTGGPLGAQSRSPLDPSQGRQEFAVELAGVGPFHPAVHVEAFGRCGHNVAHELFKDRTDGGRTARADLGNEMEVLHVSLCQQSKPAHDVA